MRRSWRSQVHRERLCTAGAARGCHGDVLSAGRGIRGDGERRCDLRGAHHRRVADGDPRAAQGDGGSCNEVRSRQRDWTLCPCTPLFGLIEVSVGGARFTVNGCAPLVPPEVVTVTFWAPVAAFAAMANVAVICVALSTVVLLTVIPAPLRAMVAPAAKFVPVRVTGSALSLHAASRADRGQCRWVQESLGTAGAAERGNA